MGRLGDFVLLGIAFFIARVSVIILTPLRIKNTGYIKKYGITQRESCSSSAVNGDKISMN
jgi:hypothetical protein